MEPQSNPTMTKGRVCHAGKIGGFALEVGSTLAGKLQQCSIRVIRLML